MASTSTLMSLKVQNEALQVKEKRNTERRSAILTLILSFLHENGYIQAASALQNEASSQVAKLEVADNMDLMTVIQEFESFYELKFDRKPRLVRRIIGNESANRGSLPGPAGVRRATTAPGSTTSNSSTMPSKGKRNSNSTSVAAPQSPAAASSSGNAGSNFLFSIQGTGGAGRKASNQRIEAFDQINDEDDEEQQPRPLRPLPHDLLQDAELRALAGTIMRDVLQHNPRIKWEDIVGLEQAKRLLCEAVVMPIQYPSIFRGLLSPWGGVLLYGPPGTGKTLLARAVASQCRTTFFNISGSSIVSKYRGDSEKLVRVLFDLARHHAPSTIFIDEIDSIMSQRGGVDGASEHEGSLRMKTELLIQMDGLSKSDALVFVLAASNLPWNLDQALVRRLEKRVMVPLPSQTARKVMLEKLLLGDYVTSSDLDLDQIAAKTEGYSGADIRLVCKEAAMRPVRRLMTKLDALHIQGQGRHVYSSTRQGAIQPLLNSEVKETLDADPVTMPDLEAALAATKPSTQFLSEKYIKWEQEHGST